MQMYGDLDCSTDLAYFFPETERVVLRGVKRFCYAFVLRMHLALPITGVCLFYIPVHQYCHSISSCCNVRWSSL